MEQLTHEDKIFEKVTYANKLIRSREFQDCTFRQCDFQDSDFAGSKFLDCTFEECNLSLMKLGNTTLNNVVFKNCKALGVNFHECTDFLFSVAFDDCVLDYASFAGKKMPKTSFVKCSLKETSFMQTILTGSRFDQCDLAGAIFNRTDLTGSNFSTAYNFTIDPEINTLKKAIFSEHGLAGLLAKYGIKVV
jgi:fluoroquinolone resistance protein